MAKETEYQKMCREAGKSKKEGGTPYGSKAARDNRRIAHLEEENRALLIQLSDIQERLHLIESFLLKSAN
jgi:hypothetical protein